METLTSESHVAAARARGKAQFEMALSTGHSTVVDQAQSWLLNKTPEQHHAWVVNMTASRNTPLSLQGAVARGHDRVKRENATGMKSLGQRRRQRCNEARETRMVSMTAAEIDIEMRKVEATKRSNDKRAQDIARLRSNPQYKDFSMRQLLGVRKKLNAQKRSTKR